MQRPPQGKPCLFLPVPAGSTQAAPRMTIGPPHPSLGYPAAQAFHPVPVRQVRVLPCAPFRSHLTTDTFASASGSGHHGPQRTFTSQMHDMPGTRRRESPVSRALPSEDNRHRRCRQNATPRATLRRRFPQPPESLRSRWPASTHFRDNPW
jgi:hypothetical protein